MVLMIENPPQVQWIRRFHNFSSWNPACLNMFKIKIPLLIYHIWTKLQGEKYFLQQQTSTDWYELWQKQPNTCKNFPIFANKRFSCQYESVTVHTLSVQTPVQNNASPSHHQQSKVYIANENSHFSFSHIIRSVSEVLHIWAKAKMLHSGMKWLAAA